MVELHAIVHGMVQGVWFRAWTRDLAREMGVSGWVRNRPDGGVEILARGERKQVEQFLDRLHDGPPLARVARIDTDWRETDQDSGRFDVRV